MPLIAEVSLAYKSTQPVETLPTITCPEEAAEYLRSIWDKNTIELREECIIVLLNNAKRVLADISITRRLVDAGKILGITVDDHIIITQSGYLSLNDEGLI